MFYDFLKMLLFLNITLLHYYLLRLLIPFNTDVNVIKLVFLNVNVTTELIKSIGLLF